MQKTVGSKNQGKMKMITDDELKVIRNSLDVPRIIFSDVICQSIGPYKAREYMYSDLGTLYVNILSVWDDIRKLKWGVGLPSWSHLCDMVLELDDGMVYKSIGTKNKCKEGYSTEWSKFVEEITSAKEYSPVEKAIRVFLWISRNQPFSNFNLELGLLIANKILSEEDYLVKRDNGSTEGSGVLSMPKKHRDSDIILWQEFSRYMNGAEDVSEDYLVKEMERLCHI